MINDVTERKQTERSLRASGKKNRRLTEELSSSQTAETQVPRGHGELILLVDDEASVRAIIRQILEAYGYAVLTAANGAEAVSFYAQHQRKVEVVLMDVLMPVMDADTLELVLRKINPAVRIISTSGRSDSEDHAKAKSARGRYFLLKPYSSETLLNSLYEILHEPRRCDSGSISTKNVYDRESSAH